MRDWLIQARDGRSQVELAKIAGVSQQALSAYETGRKTPSVKTAKRLADVYGVSWTHFFQEEAS